MTLSEALAALAPALRPTSRYVTTAVLGNGTLSAYNGEVLGLATNITDGPEDTVMLSAERLVKIWQDGARMRVGDKQVTITRKKVQFRLHRIFSRPAEIPYVAKGGAQLTSLQRDAILLGAKFTSVNATHRWACAVNVTRDGLIATNNQVLIRIPVPFDCELALPFWAVNLLKRESTLPWMSVDDRMIRFDWEDGVTLQASRLADDMPVRVFDLANHLTEESSDAVALAPLLNDMDKLDGDVCKLTSGGLTIETREGEVAQSHDIQFNGKFQMSIETAHLVFAHATHVSFIDAPDRLRFSKDSEPKIFGIAAGMR